MHGSTAPTTRQTCVNPWCKAPFEITEDDLRFYETVSPIFNGKKELIPPPTLCPDCRQQRRLSWRNERKLSYDTCDLCGKQTISMYHPESPYTVYCYDCWWGEGWDPFTYGQEIDFSRPFLAQLHELRLRVPRLYLFNLHSENCIFTAHSAHNKNCYMGVALGKCEDCYYGHWVLESKDTVDSMYCEYCERCYECSYCLHCFQTFFSRSCQQCRDCLFCYECTGCDRCIGCVGLKKKSLHLWNKPVSEEEYERTKEALLSSREAFRNFQEQWDRFQLTFPHRFALQINCVDSTGDDLYDCKNAGHCFNCRSVEDSKHIYDSGKNRSSMDTYEHGWLVQSELNYELHAGMAGYHLLFCHICAEGRDLLFCDCCHNNSKHLFGCVSLKHQEYCILNKQYSKDEYERLVPRIIELMRQNGEWGEFPPSIQSPFAYNESVAQEYFPLSKEQILERGWHWRELKEEPPKVTKIIPAEKIPEKIDDVPDDILHWAIECEATKRPFRIIKQELDFYRQMKLPIPRLHPDERHRKRMALRNPRKLWKRPCGKCGKEMETTYSPERPEVVFCESCYLKEIY